MADPSPPIIGLAGGIGAGKSAVARVLADLGCVVARADEMARDALRDPAIRDTLLRWWGRGVLDDAGDIDRAAVARIVFTRPRDRKRLESLVHPWVEAQRRALFREAPAGTRALVIDAPLLFEAGLGEACDAVIFVVADRTTRLARLAATRSWNEQDLSKREESQLPLDEKRARSDYVITNNGDLEALTEQVRRTLGEIVQTRGS
ncbi:MAG: dephospho-CoA kinase [Planctomycetota bacterium]|jgi:dephospho-CoA kinase